MAFESLTDDKIADLLNCPKKLTNPQARSKGKEGHEQVNYKVVAMDGSNHKFELYIKDRIYVKAWRTTSPVA